MLYILDRVKVLTIKKCCIKLNIKKTELWQEYE